MTEERQRQANRRNAKRSTGPRTDAGKKKVRGNAIKHGLTSRLPLLPNEDPVELEALRLDLHQELSPKSVLESILVEQIVASIWRLRRAIHVEAASLIWGMSQGFAQQALRETFQLETAKLYARQDGSAADGSETNLLIGLTKALESQRSAEATVGVLSDDGSPGAESLLNLARYVTAAERSVQRALKQMQSYRDSLGCK